MKYYYSSIAAILLLLGLFWACEDSNESLVKQRGANVVPNVEFTTPPVFTTELSTTFVEFTVSLNEGDAVDAASIEVLFNNENPTIVQEVSSFPATVRLDAKDVISKLGLDINNIQTSDVFSFFVLTTKNGVTTRSIASANIKIVCPFSPALSQGSYNAVSESWGVEGNVTLTADPDDKYKIFVEGLGDLDGVAGVDKVFFLIDPESYAITNRDKFIMSSDLEADWGAKYKGWTNYTYELVSGSYNSCDGTFSAVFQIYCSKGSYGNFTFNFTPAE